MCDDQERLAPAHDFNNLLQGCGPVTDKEIPFASAVVSGINQSSGCLSLLQAYASNLFPRQIHAAAVAGWWVILIAIGFLTLLWLVYLAVMAAHPAWLLVMWGPGVDWPFVQNVWFWAMAAFF